MPIEHVIKLVSSLELRDESINTWKIGVERALKKYATGPIDTPELNDETANVRQAGEAED